MKRKGEPRVKKEINAKRSCHAEEPDMNAHDVIAYANSDLHRYKDITIRCGKHGSFEANKIFLACHSEYFETLFYGDNRDDVGNEVNVPEVNDSEMKVILEYIYNKRIDINSDNVYALLSAADFLGIKIVKKFCFKFLKEHVNADNCIHIHSVACKHKNSLRNDVISFILDNRDKVMSCDFFKSLKEVDLKLFIQDLGSEESEPMETLRYDILSEWTHHDEKNRANDFANLALLINFNKLESEKLADYFNRQNSQRDKQGGKQPKNVVSNYLKSSVTKEETSKIVSFGGIYSIRQVASVDASFHGGENNDAQFPSLPEDRFWGCIEKLNNFVYYIGGHGGSDSVTKTVWRMNTSTHDFMWETTTSLHEARCQMKAAVLDGYICVVGGRGKNKKVLDSVEYYSENRWKHISPMQQARAEHGVVSCHGSLYAIGGYYDDDQALNSVECLHSIHGQWVNVNPMKTQRYRVVAVECKGVIYAMGGRTGSNKEILKSAEKYDTEKNKWTPICDMNFRRTGFSGCVVNERIFVFGGYDGERIVTEIECYEPLENEWKVVGEIDKKFLHNSVVALDIFLPSKK